MNVVSSMDGKYLGLEVPADTKVGDTLRFDDFALSVQFIFRLENGNLRLGSPNYQLEIEE